MTKILRFIGNLLLFLLLTTITQVGGLVYLLSLSISKSWAWPSKFKSLLVFILLYLVATFLIVPFLAPTFGREKVKNVDGIGPANFMTVLLNRNYVRPALNELLGQSQKALKVTNIQIRYLDANFPFLDQFPLLPHLSHNDGKKIDISLVYETKAGRITNKQKSISGYGVFEGPQPNEYNQINECLKKGYLQYDFPKYLTFGKTNKEFQFSQNGTSTLIKSLLQSNQLGKVFIEPHLKTRMKLVDLRIRFHGCQAVRHDDHIHLQLK